MDMESPHLWPGIDGVGLAPGAMRTHPTAAETKPQWVRKSASGMNQNDP
jgi:hypothetical protein